MGFNKKTFRQVLLFIAFGFALLMLVMYFQNIWSALTSLLSVFAPLLMGLALAFIINVPMSLIENRLFAPVSRRHTKIWPKLRRPVSLILALGLLLGLIALLLFSVIPEISKTVTLIGENLPLYAEKVYSWINGVLSYFDMSLDELTDVTIDWKKIGEYISSFMENSSEQFFSTTFGITSSIFSGIVNFIIALVFAIYILVGKERFGRNVQRIMKVILPEKRIERINYISSLSYRSFFNFVTGQCTEAVILGLLCLIGMSILRFPYATMISALIGFTALIPIVGAFIGICVGAFLILMISPVKAFWFVVFILILQQVENNAIYPRVVGKSVGLPGFWVLFAVTIGGNAFGVAGMLLGVPVMSVIYTLAGEFLTSKLGDGEPEGGNMDEKPKKKKLSEQLEDAKSAVGKTMTAVRSKRKKSKTKDGQTSAADDNSGDSNASDK